MNREIGLVIQETTVVEHKATVATKLANVNNTGGNMTLDCLSHGAQGVSMPTPKINTPAPSECTYEKQRLSRGFQGLQVGANHEEYAFIPVHMPMFYH